MVSKQLVKMMQVHEKQNLLSVDGENLTQILLDYYLFTASKALFSPRASTQNSRQQSLCSESKASCAAYDLLASLCSGSVVNLNIVSSDIYLYLSKFTINEWDYSPTIGLRPVNGYVGLKNAGATCYMNSVIQQLFMISKIKEGVLSVDEDLIENWLQENCTENVNRYNVQVLKEIQTIFGYLEISKSQSYTPTSFWEMFKLLGSSINLREQHDALEFFNSLIDSLDEAFKILRLNPITKTVLTGTFDDQKICQDCPHRYSREESFTTLSLDIRNHNSIIDSLEQYVKGDLLEGDNAYFCETCQRKVDTIKRMCIKQLPQVLTIQLKRFDYDYERDNAIKFNDYIEFPRILDMKPFTSQGIIEVEGGSPIQECGYSDRTNTQYELCGIVVHSGQANGGHYYSYIMTRNAQGTPVWYKFDDIEVTLCDLDNDEEMKSQCFGGDNMNKPVRWWNAYMLLYKKMIPGLDQDVNMSPEVPSSIYKNVQQDNLMLNHQIVFFSEEFFFFMRILIECNVPYLKDTSISQDERDKLAKSTLKLAFKFIFDFCWRTNYLLR